MLLQLNIENFALVEKLTVDFEDGFNVLSGETGAGKSIIIDAINYVLGGKVSKDLIRYGAEKAYVEAVFTSENENTKKVLEDLQIEAEEVIIISRETSHTGKSINKVNGRAQILANIRLIAETLLDIHGQHENGKLLKSSNHIYYLDNYCGVELEKHLEKYVTTYKELNLIKNKLEEISGAEGNREKTLDYLKYQIDEIDKAKLKLGEEEELSSEFDLLSNAEKINNALQESYITLYEGSEEASSLYDNLGSVIKEIKSVEKFLPKLSQISSSLENNYYNLQEIIYDIRDLKDTISTNEDELEKVNGRMYLISGLKKKYGSDIKTILDYRNKIFTQYNELLNLKDTISELKNKQDVVVKELRNIASNMHNIRAKKAKELEKGINEELSYIGMEKSTFKVDVCEEEKLNTNGYDKVSFMISTNPGEPLKFMDKIVSGGELSRIMLAIKTVIMDKDRIPSIVFDEIDTGISGRIAQRVGEKMYFISKNHQVFCVTHLPQIACLSDVHYLVYKVVKGDKTFTKIKKLNLKEKQEEISKMIGGENVTAITMEHAKEMIGIADNIKKTL